MLGCVDAVLVKKLNFDLKTPSTGSGEVERGVRDWKVDNFSVILRHVRASHTLLGKLVLFPRGELYFFNSFVMFYDSVTK